MTLICMNKDGSVDVAKFAEACVLRESLFDNEIKGALFKLSDDDKISFLWEMRRIYATRGYNNVHERLAKGVKGFCDNSLSHRREIERNNWLSADVLVNNQSLISIFLCSKNEDVRDYAAITVANLAFHYPKKISEIISGNTGENIKARLFSLSISKEGEKRSNLAYDASLILCSDVDEERGSKALRGIEGLAQIFKNQARSRNNKIGDLSQLCAMTLLSNKCLSDRGYLNDLKGECVRVLGSLDDKDIKERYKFDLDRYIEKIEARVFVINKTKSEYINDKDEVVIGKYSGNEEVLLLRPQRSQNVVNNNVDRCEGRVVDNNYYNKAESISFV